MRSLFSVVALCASLPTSLVVGQDSPLVQTANGPVQGEVVGAADVFRSVRYATPPIGDLRLVTTQPLTTTWTTPVSSAFDAPACTQPLDGHIELTAGVDEDCLYLSIAAASKRHERESGPGAVSLLPVMVYFTFGGGNECGINQNAPQLYNITSLVLKWPTSIVIAAQVRVGPLGFMATEKMMQEQGGDAGNYGYKDAIQALKYIQQNIEAFGGDPKRVMVVGESAGGNLAVILRSFAAAEGLMSAIVAESTTATLIGSLQSHASLFNQSNLMATALGCAVDDTACLRALKASDFVSLRPPTSYFNELVPTKLLPTSLLTLFKDPEQIANKVPLLIGGNSAELYNACADLPDAGPDVYNSALRSAFVDLYEPIVPDMADLNTFVEQLLTAYPADCTAGGERPCCALFDKVMNSMIIHCSSIRTAQASRAGDQPVYMYWFDQPTTCPLGFAAEGAAHTSEIAFIFGAEGASYGRVDPDRQMCTWTQGDKDLSSSMIRYWQSLATEGSIEGWTPWTEDYQVCMLLRNDAQAAEGPVLGPCPVTSDFCSDLNQLNLDMYEYYWKSPP